MAHIDCSFYAETLQKNVHVIVYLPTVSADDYLEGKQTHYYDPETRFKTLYLLHGSYGDCMDWCLRTGIERYAQEKGVAVVMPSAENSFYVNMERGEDYLRYIGEELPSFMTRMFPLRTEREGTFIAGLSMGGYGAFRIGLAYPDRFGCLASLSGALDMAALQNSKEAHMAKMPANYRKAVFSDPSAIRGSADDLVTLLRTLVESGQNIPSLYMTVGTEDFLLEDNEAFYRAACRVGLQPVYEKFPGTHNWDFWDAHIRDVLNWLP